MKVLCPLNNVLCIIKLKTEKLLNGIDKVLDKREKQIIYMRYGLDGNKEKTQQEVADILGISRSYVSRIEKRNEY